MKFVKISEKHTNQYKLTKKHENSRNELTVTKFDENDGKETWKIKYPGPGSISRAQYPVPGLYICGSI